MAENILVSGTVAFDTVETPYGKKDKILGGSANYFSIAASHFTGVELSAVIGDDFPQKHLDYLKTKKIGTANVDRIKGGKTFFWAGKYSDDMNDRETLDTQLNVLMQYNPNLDADARACGVLFLANIDPVIQLKVIEQADSAKLIILDTMDFWINSQPDNLKKVVAKSDILVINDSEAKLLTGQNNIRDAAEDIVKLGPSVLVIKRGEYGAMVYKKDEGIFVCPALLLKDVKDPTGAGDTFAGGFTGYLSTCSDPLSMKQLKEAMLYGTVMASFTVQDFGTDALEKANKSDIESRYNELVSIIKI
jgi:sugar/nucleoside kinase (ribokinase family)